MITSSRFYLNCSACFCHLLTLLLSHIVFSLAIEKEKEHPILQFVLSPHQLSAAKADSKQDYAILPDIIIPYSSYSLLFILRLLGQYFAKHFTIEQICERYDISQNRFYKWLTLRKSHK